MKNFHLNSWKFSSDEWKGISFQEFLEKKTILRGVPKISEISYRELPFHLTFPSRNFLNLKLNGSPFENATIFGFS